MLKIDKTYNIPPVLVVNPETQTHVKKGSEISTNSAQPDNFFLVDNQNNVLTNSQAFSNIIAANGTIGSLDIQGLSFGGQSLDLYSLQNSASTSAALQTQINSIAANVADLTSHIASDEATMTAIKATIANMSANGFTASTAAQLGLLGNID